MRAIILAAGVGNRLREFGDRPKSLLEFGGSSLLSRHLQALAASGIRAVTICVGYRGELVSDAARRCRAVAVHCVVNEDFRRGSIVSLWTARETLRSGDDIVLMDADVLYEPRLLSRLIESAHRNCFLLDRDFVPGDEPVKICVRAGAIVEFRKQPDPAIPYDYCGESVGFFKFAPDAAAALAARTDAYLGAGRCDEPYEEAIRDLTLERQQLLGFEDITGSAWIEIDFPEDISRARDEILPRIARADSHPDR